MEMSGQSQKRQRAGIREHVRVMAHSDGTPRLALLHRVLVVCEPRVHVPHSRDTKTAALNGYGPILEISKAPPLCVFEYGAAPNGDVVVPRHDDTAAGIWNARKGMEHLGQEVRLHLLGVYKVSPQDKQVRLESGDRLNQCVQMVAREVTRAMDVGEKRDTDPSRRTVRPRDMNVTNAHTPTRQLARQRTTRVTDEG